jgi:uncharacterized protein YbaP (TraB family)
MAERRGILPKLQSHDIFSHAGMRARAVAALALSCLLAAAPVVAPAAERFGQGLLWRVEGKGAMPSHVFGTIHLADPRVTRLPPAVADALERSRSVVLELKLEPASLQALAARMLFSDGRDLPGVIGEELFKRSVAAAGGLGLPEPALRMLKPWALGVLLSVPPQNPADVLDVMLARIAAERGKPLHELESMEEQVAVFDDMPDADQAMMLRQALDNHDNLPRLLGSVIEAYLARDLAAIWRIREKSGGKDGAARRFNEAFMRRLLHDRNARMAERAEPRLQEGGAFIAVGALHLYGDGGVLAEIERRGWRVTRIY